MKKFLAFSLFIISTCLYAQKTSNDYKEQWQKVYSYEINLLPKSANKEVHKIHKKAKRCKNSAQIIKSLIYKSKFALILEDSELIVIQDLKNEIAGSTPPTKNILESVLADIYWQYLKKHRWKIYNRGNTDKKVNSDDFRTWSLSTLFSEIQLHYNNSLYNKVVLQETLLEKYNDILKTETDSKIYRPSLYDFLAHNALSFLKTNEHLISKPNYQFEIDRETYFTDFLNTNFTHKDSSSHQIKTLQTYQELALFHQKDKNPTAYITVLIEAYEYLDDNSSLKNKKELLLHTYQKLRTKYRHHAISTQLDFKIAKIFRNEANSYTPTTNNEFRFKNNDALEICETAMKMFPKSEGAKNCAIIKEQILNSSLRITTEKNIPSDQVSRVLVDYKNIHQLYFKIYKLSYNQLRKFNKIRNDSTRNVFVKGLELTKNWNTALRNENDYQKHTTEIVIPKLSLGNYLIYASKKETLSTNQSHIAYSTLQVTNLALIESEQNNKHLYQVVNRTTGKPIHKAKVNLLTFDSSNNNYYKPIDKTFTTDKNGQFSYKSKNDHRKVIAIISTNNETAEFGEYYISENDKRRNYSKENKEIIIKTFFFSDRSIYRPGQKVYFKAIVLKKTGNKTELFTDEYIEITIKNPNGETVKTLEFKLNEYGSFSGEFDIPNNGLTGRYRFDFDQGYKHDSKFYDNEYFDFDYNSHSISVEEYKRPKFTTTFEPVTETFKLNDRITALGTATAFSGSKITNAKVSYRVERTANFPWWFYRNSFSPQTSASLEICHGETLTDAQGNYKIIFKAIPDTKIAKESQPTFIYKVYAAVTDVNGETHDTETAIKIGYHSLELTINLADKIDKNRTNNQISIDSKNLNNQAVDTKGELEIYKITAAKNPLRDRSWSAPDYQDIPENKFEELFPHEPYNKIDNKKGALVLKKTFNTKESKSIKLKNIKNWVSGKYIATLTGKDKFGQTVKQEKEFSVFSLNDKKVADHKLLFIQTDKNSYTPKENVLLNIGSSSKNITITIDIEKNHKIVSSYFVSLNNEIKTISIPVTEKDRGGFTVKYSFVNYNQFKNGSIYISVPFKENNLIIETLSFRDKLQPGSEQTWSFKIKGNKKEKVAAEILASMYDASLDEFKKHDWSFNPTPKQLYYPYGNSKNAYTSFGTKNFRTQNRKTIHNYYSKQNFDQLNWFGFSLNRSKITNSNYLRTIPSQRKKFDGSLSGTITDEEGLPLPGVQIMVENTAYGTVSDFDGNYTLNIKKNDLVVFSYIGFKTFVTKIKNSAVLNIELIADETSLEEVIVVGYGTQKHRTKVNADALQGIVPGLLLETTEIEEISELEIDYEEITNTKEEQKKIQEELNQIQARSNFNETAFFFPNLRTDKNGTIRFEFTIPEALTKWKMQLLAHTKDLRYVRKTMTTISQKDLMVTPNAPRFLREGDTLIFSSKIASLTDKELNGFAQLHLTDALTGKDINLLLNNTNKQQQFHLSPKGNTHVSWTIVIPENITAVQYKIVAKAGGFSDGEQNILPVLSNRVLVTETLPLWVNSNQTKTFELKKLKNNSSTTLTHHKLTLEITSNPAWYALQALPYLMEYPYECSEQTFSKYYANTLANHVVNSNPKIKEVFKQWNSSKILISNLEKNEELKSIIIQETPWLRDAQSETEQKKRIALLFDLKKLKEEQSNSLDKLEQMQMGNGGFPWFKGCNYANRNITQHIIAGFGHLNNLGIEQSSKKEKKIIKKALKYLDKEIEKEYQRILERAKEIREKSKSTKKGIIAEKKYLQEKHIASSQLHYLYLRNFFKTTDIPKQTVAAIRYYKKQAQHYWKQFSLYNKALAALVMYEEKPEISLQIVASLKENSIYSEQLGMYWKENKSSWYWYQSPVETQSLLIEVFSKLEKDQNTIDGLKKWLLKNKQTNRWKTTKATTEAVYALLLYGTDWLSIEESVAVKIAGKKIDASKLENTKKEAGTGYFKTTWNAQEIKPEMALISLEKKDKGMAWGALYWQYFEDLDKITSAETQLKIDKKLFLKRNTDTGVVLKEIKKETKLNVGDIITVRIEIKTDRYMEFVHMKDMRASGLEPLNVISKYKWQDGLGYYQSTKDASTNFFFDKINKGIYVFEYDARINNAGNYSTGITTIQCMYAPEFSSHSSGKRIQFQ